MAALLTPNSAINCFSEATLSPGLRRPDSTASRIWTTMRSETFCDLAAASNMAEITFFQWKAAPDARRGRPREDTARQLFGGIHN